VDTFIQKYQSDVMGSLSGLDRLVLTGRLRMLSFSAGMMGLLSQASILLKDFGSYAEAKTKELRKASEAAAKRLQRPMPYLRSSKISKEDTARRIAEQDGVREGLICVLEVVEPCMGYDVESRDGRLTLVYRLRKCLFLYHYFIHPIFGFMHASLQTWFPFPIQVCLNGREWLARQMDRAGLEYERADNCFRWLADVTGAQELAREQLKLDWISVLNRIAEEINPALQRTLAPYRALQYYWSVRESEWATDIMFRTTARLETFYPCWIRTAIAGFHTSDVLRFLGQKLSPRSKPPLEVTTSYKERPEGVRVRHNVGANSVKAYNKAGNLLRVETTMNSPKGFRHYRRREDGTGALRSRPLRHGVSDLFRRTQISQAINSRYLEALAAIEVDQTLEQLVRPLCRTVHWKGRPVRALSPWSEKDQALLASVNRGEWVIAGFRNRDLRQLLYGEVEDPAQAKRLSGKVTRSLRLLRGHGLITKIPRSNRYRITNSGRLAAVALSQAQRASVKQLAKIAA
jgi:hypothetical protein